MTGETEAANEIVVEPPFLMHHLTGGARLLMDANRRCWLLAPGGPSMAFGLKAGAPVEAALKSYGGAIRIIGRAYFNTVEELQDHVHAYFALRACASNNTCLATSVLHRWKGMTHALGLDGRGPEALLSDRVANHIGLALRRLQKLSIAYQKALVVLNPEKPEPESKSMTSNKYAQDIGIEYRALVNELCALREAICVACFRLHYKRDDAFKTKKLKSLLASEGGKTAALLAASMFEEDGGDLLIERMSLYRNVAQHCLGSNSPIFGDVYTVGCASGALGTLRWLIYPLYDDMERLRRIEQGDPSGIISKVDQAEASRFIGKDHHLDAMEFCYDCFVRLLSIADSLSHDLRIEPKMVTITDADILEAEFADEQGSRRLKRHPITGQLDEFEVRDNE